MYNPNTGKSTKMPLRLHMAALPPIEGEDDATPVLMIKGGLWVACYLSYGETLSVWCGNNKVVMESGRHETPQDAVADLHQIVAKYHNGKADEATDAPICYRCGGNGCSKCKYGVVDAARTLDEIIARGDAAIRRFRRVADKYNSQLQNC